MDAGQMDLDEMLRKENIYFSWLITTTQEMCERKYYSSISAQYEYV